MSWLVSRLLNGLYGLALVVCSPLLLWSMLTTGKYRDGWRHKLWGLVPVGQSKRSRVWFHAVSVGEVNVLAGTLAELDRRRAVDISISTTTKTGYDLARRKYGDRCAVFYCPLDFSWAVRTAMRRVRPDLLVLAELELWPNLIAAAKSHGARVVIINGRLSDNSFRGYQRLGWLVRRVLEQIDLIAAQDESTAQRFRHLGAPPARVVATGSLKYDGAETNRHNPRTLELGRLAGLTEHHLVWLAGSTQAPEEEIAIRVFRKLSVQFPQLRLILVPRHPERFGEVAALLAKSGHPWQRRSNLKSEFRNHKSEILLVDTIGELGHWWGTADLGFVGGSFGDRGGQNMIEPAAYGVATSFGPNTRNFRDIVAALLAADGARVVADEAELEAFVQCCLEDEAYRRGLGERSRKFVATQLGATSRTVDLLSTLLPGKQTQPIAA